MQHGYNSRHSTWWWRWWGGGLESGSSSSSSSSSGINSGIGSGGSTKPGSNNPMSGNLLRLGLLAFTGLLAAAVTKFGAVVSFLGWLAFGVLSFAAPPTAYMCALALCFTPEQLARGAHYVDWMRQLREEPPPVGGGGGASSPTAAGGGGGVLSAATEGGGAVPPGGWWLWERIGLACYVGGGVAMTVAGLCMVVVEARHDHGGADAHAG